MKAKTIEVDKDKLTEYIVNNCPHFSYNYVRGETCRSKVDEEMCDLHVFGKELHCPYDCPRLVAKEYSCDRGRCPKVRAIIKELKA